MKKFSNLDEQITTKYELKDSLRNDIYSIIENSLSIKIFGESSLDKDISIVGKEELVEKIKSLIDDAKIKERVLTLEHVKANVHRNFDMKWLNEQIDSNKKIIDYSKVKPGHQAYMKHDGKTYQVKIDSIYDDNGHPCEPNADCMVGISWTLNDVPRKDSVPIDSLQIIQ